MRSGLCAYPLGLGLPSNISIRKLAREVGVFRIGGARTYEFTRFLVKKLIQKLYADGLVRARADNRCTVNKDDLLAVLAPYRVV